MSLDEKLNPEQSADILIEDKFEKNLIPTTKIFGIITGISNGVLDGIRERDPFIGFFSIIVGIMLTFGLCILLEGFSTTIRLLRKIAEK